MVRISSRVLLGASVLALMVAMGCGGSETPDLPNKVVDTPVDPPINKPAPIPMVDKEITAELTFTERDPWSETGEKNPRIVSFGRGGGVQIESSEAIDVALNSDFTLELWMRPMGKTQPQILAMKGLHLSMDNGLLHVESSGEPTEGLELRSKEWHHIAIVVEQQQLSVYINGQRGSKKQVAATWAPKGPLTLGVAEGSNHGPFVGEMDNVRLISGARYKSNFLPSSTFVPADTFFAYDFNGVSRGTDVPATWGKPAKLTGDAKLVPGTI